MTYRILLPLDGTEAVENFVPWLGSLICREDAEVILTHVLPTLVEIESGEARAEINRAEALLAAAKAALASLNCAVTTRVAMGDSAEEILKLAMLLPASVVVTATHGRSGLNRLLEGSVTEQVLRNLECPMFALHRTAPVTQEGEQRLVRRILVPVDGTEESLRVLPWVEEIARTTKARIVLYNDDIGLAEPDEEPAAEIAHQRVHDTFMRLKDAGFDVALDRTKQQDLNKDIMWIIKDMSIDLVAMVTHGRRGIRRVLSGSVTEHVLRKAECPLLVLSLAEEKHSAQPVEEYLG